MEIRYLQPVIEIFYFNLLKHILPKLVYDKMYVQKCHRYLFPNNKPSKTLLYTILHFIITLLLHLTNKKSIDANHQRRRQKNLIKFCI
jgi:hypothetical protein